MTDHDFIDLTSSEVVSGLHSKIATAYIQTTDNTQTTLWSVPIPVLSAATFQVIITCKRDDDSEAAGGTAIATFRRASGGNVTLVGAVVLVDEDDSSGTPAWTMDADTTAQTVRLRVTGETAKVFDWTATILYQLATF